MSDVVAHHSLGGSSAGRWTVCPASAALCAMLPDPPESPYAKEGTRAHALGEYCLRNNCEPYDLVGVSVPGTDDDTRIDKEMADAVKVYTDAVRECAKKHKGELYVEVRFEMPFLPADENGRKPFGTNDACVRTKSGELHVYDYKHGAGKYVSEKSNDQLLYYALGAAGYFKSKKLPVHTVHTYIVQPRCGDPVRAVRGQTYSAAELLDHKLWLIQRARATCDPNAAFVPGEHCKGTWCKGALQNKCKAFRDAALEVLKPTKSPFDSVEIPADIETPDPTQMDSDALAEQLAKLPMLKTYISCLEDFAMSEAKAGRPPRGYKLVHGAGRRDWVDEQDALFVLTAHTNEDVAPRKLVSVAQAEKLLGKKRFAETEELSRLVTRKAGALQLVPEDDKRPAVDAAPLFDEVEIPNA